jgi:hypothetical protein
LTVSPFPRTPSFHFTPYNQTVALALCPRLLWHVSCGFLILGELEFFFIYRERSDEINTNRFLTKEFPMKRIILLGMVSVMMLVSMGGCWVGLDVDERDGRHHRDGYHHRDRGHDRDGDRGRDQGHEERR